MRIPFIFTLLISIALYSCNTDDPSTDDDINQDPPAFFPLTANSYWTYNNQNEQLGPSRDSLYVAGNENQNGIIYTNLDAEIPASAFMTQFFSNNLVRTTETQLIIDGALGSPIQGLPDITLSLNDLLLFDTTVDVNEDPVLGLSTGTVLQEIMEVPIEINYGITSTMLPNPSTTSESELQIVSQLSVNMEIIANITVGPVTVPFTVMQSQDVLVATNTYTDGIGLTASQVIISFTLEDLSGVGVELPFPENSNNTTTQDINTFFIGED